MNTFLPVINVFNAAFTVFIISVFFRAFLVRFKLSGKRMFIPYAGVFAAVCLMTEFVDYPLALAILMWLLTFFAGLFYDAPLMTKLFSSVVVNILFVLCEVVVAFVMALFSSTDIGFVTTDATFYIYGVLISNTLTFTIVKALQFFKAGGGGTLPFPKFVPLVSLPVATMMAIYVMSEYTHDAMTRGELLTVAVSVMALIASNLYVIHVFERQVKMEHDRKVNLLVQQQLSLQKDHFKELLEKQRLSNKTLHDAKNRLHAITAKLNSGETDYAVEKMNELCLNVFNTVNMIDTGNHALDALINSKHAKISQSGVEFSASVFMAAENEIDDIDLCVLVGNALDNAIEACGRMGKGDTKWIRLKIMQINDNLSVSLTNTCDSRDIAKNATVSTVKSDKNLHGFGLKSMRDITDKYNGYMEFFVENKVFHLKIFMSNRIPRPNPP